MLSAICHKHPHLWESGDWLFHCDTAPAIGIFFTGLSDKE
jgi:hypothetical protein